MDREEALMWLKQNMTNMTPQEFGRAFKRYGERYVIPEKLKEKLAAKPKQKTVFTKEFDGGL